MRKKYETDLTDEQWEVIAPLFVNMRNRNPNPTYALIDSQSVKTIYAADQRGFDGEKTKGRKRHVVTDTLGCLLNVTVHSVKTHDTKLGYWSAGLAILCYPTIKRFCADRGYRGTFIYDMNRLFSRGVDISEKIKSATWHVEPKRWAVERTFAWLNNSRRLSKD